jgi:uncharacterized membrane protein YfcA
LSTSSKKYVWRLVKLLILVALVAWVISQGGFNADRMKGILPVIIILIAYLAVKDFKKYRQQKYSFLKSLYLS